MKIERTKNASRNIIFGVILKTHQILFPFIMRTAIIYLMGVQYLGLNSLFTSVLQVLNLAELGIGSAMVYSMYKPIAEDDSNRICALMRLYKLYYRGIGFVIAGVGIILTPIIPKLIRGDVPSEINIYILYLLNLGATVLSYWLFAYKNSILQAHQRTDVVSKVTLVTNTVQYVLQFWVLWIFRNYYNYVVIMLATQAFTNIITAFVADKMYPDYQPQGKLDKEEIKGINQRIKDLFTAKLGSVIVGAVGTIVISAFLGLKVLAVYQNYYFIMNAICGFITVIFGAVTAGIGNSLITESIEKNYSDFKKLSFIICFILCICCCCFIGLYQPFMKLWVGEGLMLSFDYVIIFCILFYLLELAMVWATMKDAAGLWHADRFRPLIGALLNLALSIILVQYIGLYGIMLSTIISYVFISMPWLIYNLFRLLYKQSIWNYMKDIFVYVLVTLFCCMLTNIFCGLIKDDSLFILAMKAVISVLIPIFVQGILFFSKKEFKDSIVLVKKMLKIGV